MAKSREIVTTTLRIPKALYDELRRRNLPINAFTKDALQEKLRRIRDVEIDRAFEDYEESRHD